MRGLFAATLLCLVVSTSTATAQAVQETGKKAHETVVDGRWEVKLGAEQPAFLFEFKNTDGVVSGTMSEEGKLTEIKNGTLEASTLKFQTTKPPAAGAEPITMAWTATLSDDGESLTLTCTPASDNSGLARQMKARRVK